MKRIKKYVSIIVTLIMVLNFTACGSGDRADRLQKDNNVQKAIDEQIAKETGSVQDSSEAVTEETDDVTTEAESNVKAETENAVTTEAASDTGVAPEAKVVLNDGSESAEETKGPADPNVDIDISVMNSDMVYATVYQLMADAESYFGKKIKVEGIYNAAYDEEMKQYYHYVVITDATACCQQGLEFQLDDGSRVYPDDYPELGSEIMIIGTFEEYKDHPEDEYSYVRLGNASLEVVDSTAK